MSDGASESKTTRGPTVGAPQHQASSTAQPVLSAEEDALLELYAAWDHVVNAEGDLIEIRRREA
jgi:hypothetical protein